MTVDQNNKNRFNVYFYGTGGTAVVKTDDMVLYDAAKMDGNQIQQIIEVINQKHGTVTYEVACRKIRRIIETRKKTK